MGSCQKNEKSTFMIMRILALLRKGYDKKLIICLPE